MKVKSKLVYLLNGIIHLGLKDKILTYFQLLSSQYPKPLVRITNRLTLIERLIDFTIYQSCLASLHFLTLVTRAAFQSTRARESICCKCLDLLGLKTDRLAQCICHVQSSIKENKQFTCTVIKERHRRYTVVCDFLLSPYRSGARRTELK